MRFENGACPINYQNVSFARLQRTRYLGSGRRRYNTARRSIASRATSESEHPDDRTPKDPAAFQRADPILAKVIRQVGPVTLKPQRNRFQTLVQSIISQQISMGAARAIRLRLEKRLEPDGIRPEAILRLSVEQLREIGLSRPKAGYMLDLAQKCGDGTVRLPSWVG